MLSRVADSVYWMNRYIERAENVARFIDVNLHLMLDLAVGTTEQWQPLVDTTGDRQTFAERYGEARRSDVVDFLTSDRENPNSIVSCLRQARDNARSVRDIISSEMWEQINTFYFMVRDAAARKQIMDAPHAFFSEVRNACLLFAGITDMTMSHGEGWHFGRRQNPARACHHNIVLHRQDSCCYPREQSARSCWLIGRHTARLCEYPDI